MTLKQYFDDAVWISRSLFDRGKISGSSANISFRYEDRVFISGTGTCFGTLTRDMFSELDFSGTHISGIVPSKEFPLHLMLYKNIPETGAVIHTHSFYATLWSCYKKDTCGNAIPKFTPYLEMKLGRVTWVPYAPPGSPGLFELFAKSLNLSRGYLLHNHGPIVCDKNLLSAFYDLEELEESARIAWELRNEEVIGI
jgi:ribulose-5-phosphate 4-epimerase/fuculose-1-phosphate aldolase